MHPDRNLEETMARLQHSNSENEIPKDFRIPTACQHASVDKVIKQQHPYTRSKIKPKMSHIIQFNTSNEENSSQTRYYQEDRFQNFNSLGLEERSNRHQHEKKKRENFKAHNVDKNSKNQIFGDKPFSTMGQEESKDNKRILKLVQNSTPMPKLPPNNNQDVLYRNLKENNRNFSQKLSDSLRKNGLERSLPILLASDPTLQQFRFFTEKDFELFPDITLEDKTKILKIIIELLNEEQSNQINLTPLGALKGSIDQNQWVGNFDFLE